MAAQKKEEEERIRKEESEKKAREAEEKAWFRHKKTNIKQGDMDHQNEKGAWWGKQI